MPETADSVPVLLGTFSLAHSGACAGGDRQVTPAQRHEELSPRRSALGAGEEEGRAAPGGRTHARTVAADWYPLLRVRFHRDVAPRGDLARREDGPETQMLERPPLPQLLTELATLIQWFLRKGICLHTSPHSPNVALRLTHDIHALHLRWDLPRGEAGPRLPPCQPRGGRCPHLFPGS